MSAVEHAAAADGAKRTITLLTVDDQPCSGRPRAQWPRSTPGFEVVAEAADGDAAIRIAREVDPDMVIVDVRMAGRDGIDTARALTDEDPTRLVVLVSSADVRELSALARARGRRRAAAQALAHAAPAARPLGRPPPAVIAADLARRRIASAQRVGWSGHRSPTGPSAGHRSIRECHTFQAQSEGRCHSRQPPAAARGRTPLVVGSSCLVAGAASILAGVFVGWHSDRDQVDRAVVEAAIVGVPVAVGLYASSSRASGASGCCSSAPASPGRSPRSARRPTAFPTASGASRPG